MEDEEGRRIPISVQKLSNSKSGFNSYVHFNTHDTYLIRRPLAFYFEKSLKCIDYQLIQFSNVRIVLTHRMYHLKQNPNNKHIARYCNERRPCSPHEMDSPSFPRGTLVGVTLVTRLILSPVVLKLCWSECGVHDSPAVHRIENVGCCSRSIQ